MTPENTGYRVQRQVHINSLDPLTGQVAPGWQITVFDRETGVVVPVFVPDDRYTEENARAYIEAALGPVRKVHQLGR